MLKTLFRAAVWRGRNKKHCIFAVQPPDSTGRRGPASLFDM